MENTKKTVLLLLAVACVGVGMAGCVKAYEDEQVEVIRRPQVDVEPHSPGWDDGGTENIE